MNQFFFTEVKSAIADVPSKKKYISGRAHFLFFIKMRRRGGLFVYDRLCVCVCIDVVLLCVLRDARHMHYASIVLSGFLAV